ncbi:Clavaminate synthase-like protein [Cylindrobasidium torrendii FP15055 ss-10]|uniref:Clavaminate synthase-like protein n=1 Tax=Cylindrobasidium torrendii FP15055 ss-10 TaxID=1314674 RepID=A0A0D7B7A6_9AGAR|nr:Clavaminate synthase-like protein [Cylindrobasidium torrendii FP15055 ss-10]
MAARDSTRQDARQLLAVLAGDAYTTLSSVHGASTLCWRQYSADAFTLQSLTTDDEVNAISILDRCIITTGGASRLDLIHELIVRYQHKLPASLPSDPADFAIESSSSPLLASSSHPVLSLPVPPTFSAFVARHCNAPFVSRGHASDWPALTEHPWRSPAYLLSASGPARIVPVEVGADYRSVNWKQELMAWDKFLHSLRHPEGDPIYLAQHNLFTQFPALQSDIIVPDYAYASPPSPKDYPAYRPPGNEDQLVLNAWLGPKGTMSPAHTDPYFNLYTQVVGRKTVWLAPPTCSQDMSASTDQMLGNTSVVDVFASLDKLDEAFVERVVPQAMHITLEPGDTLFFPPGWWHAMRAEDVSFSVSMWF